MKKILRTLHSSSKVSLNVTPTFNFLYERGLALWMFTFITLVIAVVLIAVMVIRGWNAITLIISSTTEDSLGLILQLVVASQGSYRMLIYKVQDKVVDIFLKLKGLKNKTIFESSVLHLFWKTELWMIDWGVSRPPHTAQTQTNGQLPLSNHSVASRLTRSAEKLHWHIPPWQLPTTQ